jgi:CRP-like cAMP-binding protein
VSVEEIFFPFQTIKPKAPIFSRDQHTSHVHLLRSGMCAGYDLLSDGRRQIITIYLPGDLINVPAVYSDRGSQHIIAMSEAVVGTASLADIRRAINANADLERHFVFDLVRRNAMLEAWVCTLGRKSAIERMAMFFCEIFTRLAAAGQTEGRSCPLPLNQLDLADILGISVVHVSRVLKTMRDNNLVSFEGGKLQIFDLDRMMAIAEFDPAYLG